MQCSDRRSRDKRWISPYSLAQHPALFVNIQKLGRLAALAPKIRRKERCLGCLGALRNRGPRCFLVETTFPCSGLCLVSSLPSPYSPLATAVAFAALTFSADKRSSGNGSSNPFSRASSTWPHGTFPWNDTSILLDGKGVRRWREKYLIPPAEKASRVFIPVSPLQYVINEKTTPEVNVGICLVSRVGKRRASRLERAIIA